MQRERKANTGRGRSRQVHSHSKCHQDRTRNTRAAAETQTSKAQPEGNVEIIPNHSKAISSKKHNGERTTSATVSICLRCVAYRKKERHKYRQREIKTGALTS